MSVRVLAPGALTTVQDGGRRASRALGVGCSGALDPDAAAVANLLVGNAVDAAVLEITLAGPRLQFDTAARIAICGAHVDVRADDIPIPGWRPIGVPAGTRLSIGACRDGARAWLAIAGGFAVDPVLGSRSTDLRGGFGGVGGRALIAGDVLEADAAGVDRLQVARWWVEPTPEFDRAGTAAVVRVLPGRGATEPADALFAREWRVAADSNRQGLRLPGDAVHAADDAERIAEPIAPGTLTASRSCCWPTRRPTAAIHASATPSVPTGRAWRRSGRAIGCASCPAPTMRPRRPVASRRNGWRGSPSRSRRDAACPDPAQPTPLA